MVAVGSDIVVFGGSTESGEEGHCVYWPASRDMSDITPTIAPRAAAVRGRMVSSRCAVTDGTRVWVDRAGVFSNDLFRFSTTTLQWEQLDADLVSGSPPSARDGHDMVAVGSVLIVFGGWTDSSEEARCACWPPSRGMSDIAPTIAPLAAAVRAQPHGLERGCRAWRHQGLVVTRGVVQ